MRGQVAVEALAILALLLFVGLSFYFFEYLRSIQVLEERLSLDERRVARQVADEINTAAIVGDGYEHSFELPTALSGGVDYSISVDTTFQEVAVNWSEGTMNTASIVTANVTGSPLKGPNIVRNTGGVISFV